MDDMLEDTAQFELSFSPNVSLVSTVRRFVSEFYSQILFNDDATSQLAVATHELLDNAVLYSFDGNTSIRVGVRKTGSELRVRIETKNRASPSNIEAISTMLDKLRVAEDPVLFFQNLMRESAKRVDGSGLGLARVRAESEMSIDYDIHGDLVHLRAVAHFKSEQRGS
jgi:anti-sigma regulatory factor (Ser/Thr protein kinase)